MRCSNHFISGIERGVDSPSLGTLERLAAALSTTLGYLVADEDRPEDPALNDLTRALESRRDPRLLRVLCEVAELYTARTPPRPKRRH
jgi:transcriptional regulator with XRE-family HTH domain